MKITGIRGFADILPGEVEIWQVVEAKARQVFDAYNFAEIRIPILEKTELFSRSIGETTDIVEKEMYTFEDRDSRSRGSRRERPSLRSGRKEPPAWCAPTSKRRCTRVEPVRKLYYMGPMFRRERPQKGRMRQFHQIGAEALGRGDPLIDAEILLLLHDFFAALGLTEPSLQINSLGRLGVPATISGKASGVFESSTKSRCATIAGGASIAIHCALWIAKSPAVSRDEGRAVDTRFALRRLPGAFRHGAAIIAVKPTSNSLSIRAWCAGWIIIAARRSSGRPHC